MSPRQYKSNRFVVVMIGASLFIHGGLYAAILRDAQNPKPKNEVVEFEFVKKEPPPPPEPEKPLPEPEKKEPVVRKPKKVAMIKRAPPPPNSQPKETPPPTQEEAPPVKIGISMDSTTTAGGISVGVGNSLYGKADKVASDPSEVKPYAAPKAPYVPPSRVSTLPRLMHQIKPPYPPEAKKAGIEGQVILMLTIDETGKVAKVRIISGPGYGLEQAAEQTALKFKFSPATVDGESVATEIRYVYTFILE